MKKVFFFYFIFSDYTDLKAKAKKPSQSQKPVHSLLMPTIGLKRLFIAVSEKNHIMSILNP